MILQRLRLQNFRPYRGNHEVSFAFDRTKNVTVISGLNGSGKTSLFYALNWVLYGPDGLPEGVINRGALREDRTARARVELEFLHDGKRYVARRIQKLEASGAEHEDSFTLEEHRAGGRIETIVNPTRRINVILPADAKPYFFFDADRFRDFVSSGPQVLEAVRSVLKLKVLERMAQHLGDSAKEYRKHFRDADTGHEVLFDAAEKLEASLDSATDRLAAAKTAVTTRQVILRTVQLRLGALAEAAEDQRREDAAKERVEDIASKLESVSRKLHEAMARSASIVAGPGVLTATRVIDEKRVRGEVPSGIKHQLIDDLIAHGTCVCGRPLDAGARRALEERRRGGIADSVVEQVAHVSANLRALEVRSETTLEALKEHIRRRSELDDALVEAERELDEVQERRRGKSFSEDVFQQLENSRRVSEASLIDAKTEVRMIERDIEQTRDELQRTRVRLAAAQAKSVAAKQAKERYDLASRAAEAAAVLLERYGEEKRRLIEEATDSMFRRFHWKKLESERVRVGEDYSLQVIHHGTDDLAGRSEGEKQMLSLAFLVGMTKVSGEDAPLVIDTPFARLSEEPATNIVAELPELTHQLVLLVTDREIEPDAERVLAPRVGKRYVIRFNDSSEESALEAQA